MQLSPARRRFIVLTLLLVTACEPEATPFPVDIPATSPPTVTPGAVTPIRYALDANAAGSVKDLDLLQASAQVTQLEAPIDPAEPGTLFDLVAGYGIFPDATTSSTQVHYGLIIYPVAPLDDPVLADIVRRSTDPAAISARVNIPGIQLLSENRASVATLRAELANAGWPDGFDLWLAYDNLLGANALQAYWQSLGIHIKPTLSVNDGILTPLVLVTWNSPEARQKWLSQLEEPAVLIDLFSIPISYRVIPGLQITYSPQGWPIPSRP